MKIGVDLDNTIINYESVFGLVGVKYGWLPSSFLNKNKEEIKLYLREEKRLGEKTWMKIQGKAYGIDISYARPMQGVLAAFDTMLEHEINLVVVSHKTKYGHYDETKTNLRTAALNFLDENNFFKMNESFNEDHINFYSSLDDKIKGIIDLDLDLFIDDLYKVLNHPLFPQKTKKILFGKPTYTGDLALDFNSCSWKEVTELILGWQKSDIKIRG